MPQAPAPSPAALPHNPVDPAWKPDWTQAREHHRAWWRGEGLVLAIEAHRPQPREDVTKPEPPASLHDRWFSADYRSRLALARAAETAWVGDAVPVGRCITGPGELAAILGSPWSVSESTVWYEPCLNDDVVAADRPIPFDPNSPALATLLELARAALAVADGRYLVGITDLIEHFDILAAMRGSETLMMDLVERPDWAERRLAELNRHYFDVYDRFYHLLKDDDGAVCFEAFGTWGPGRTAKVQCDACGMISPAMFKRFVTPFLDEQCRWLDYSMYHLDGEECTIHLDALLEIDALDAIEWTPKHTSLGEGGGHPRWYDLYRRILDAGKSVQAIRIKPDELLPLLDAVGGKGMYVVVACDDLDTAERLVDRAEAYR